jgi:CHAT domain-containing protein/tetratricopeptide (TPR) repeat protein
MNCRAVHIQLFLLSGLVVLLQGLGCVPARAGFVPTTPWTVVLQPAASGGLWSCNATAVYESFPDMMVEGSADLSVRPNGTAALRFSTIARSIAPQWLVQQAGAVRPDVKARRVWFDRGAAFPVKLISNGLAYLEMDFGDANHLLDALDGSRKLTLETEPARSGIGEYGQRASSPNEAMEFRLDNTAELVRHVRVCLQSPHGRQSFTPTILASPGEGIPKQVSLLELIEHRQADVRAAERDQPGSAALATALLRLADAQSEAFQLSDARENYRSGLSLAEHHQEDVLEQAQARSRLIMVDLDLEQLDEAEALARSTPDPRPWIAAIMVMRGDHASGRRQFLTLLGELAGQSFADMQAFKNWNLDRDVLMAPQRLEAMRGLLLLWARAALGQEDWVSYDSFHSFYGESGGPGRTGSVIPAALIAESVFTSLDPRMIRDDVHLDSATRAALGQAAFIRGDSLLRAGDLASVSSDLSYAASELAGLPEAEGWAERTRIARLRLAADLGFDEEKLQDAQKALDDIKQALEERSEIWVEAAVVVATLQLRRGDAPGAAATALRASEVASAALGDSHSLTMKLRLLLAAARVSQDDLDGAGKLVANALGFPAPPPITIDRLDALHSDRQVWSDAAARLREIGRLLDKPSPPRLDRPVVERLQSARAQQLLGRVLQRLSSSPERPMLQAVLEFARAEDLALRHADHDSRLTEAHLNGPPETLPGLLQQFQFLSPSDQVNVSMLNVLWSIDRYAVQFLRPDLVVPADFRPTLRYGEEMTALEHLLNGLRRLFDEPGATAADRNIVLDAALRLAAAASRGDASATISAHFYASAPGMWGNLPMGSADDTRQAVSTALFAQRLRSALRLQLGNVTDKTGDVELRRLYVRALAYATYASEKMTGAFSGETAGSFSYIGATEIGTYDVHAQAYARNLGPHQAVVIWLPLESSTAVFVIGPNTTAWHELPEGRRALGGQVAAIRYAIERAAKQLGGPTQPSLVAFPTDEARELYRILFDPLAADLHDVTHIFCAQLGVVGGLPLHLLRTDPAGGDAAPGWLGDRFAITRMPGLLNPVLLYGAAQVTGPRRRLLAVGAPAVSSVSAVDAWSGNSGVAAVLRLPKLRHAAEEIRKVAQALGAVGNQSAILEGQDATWSTVTKELTVSKYDIMMFATHGLVGREVEADIGEPSLVLASPSQHAWFDDGLLHASDVAALHAAADLVILSACSTASLGEDGSEPLAGLASAFMTAGGRSVVASYWTLDDAAAEELTSALVRAHYSDHIDVAEALQRAMAELRGSGGANQAYQNPVYWAPFEVIGLPWRQPPPSVTPQRQPNPAALPSTRSDLAPQQGSIPVPLDPEASRLVEEGFDAERRGDCELGRSRIRALFQLIQRSGRSAQQQAQIRSAAMALIAADRRCQIASNATHTR